MRLRRLLLTAPLSLLAGCGHIQRECREAACDDPTANAHLDTRQLVAGPLAAQAANGATLDATLFTRHFRSGFERAVDRDVARIRRVIEPSAELTPAGVAVVERQAREAPAGALTLYVQGASDVPLDPKDVKKSVARRAALNAERAAAVREVASALRPDLAVQVAVLDLADVGIGYREAATGMPKFNAAPEGQLSPTAISGAAIGSSNFGFGGVSGGQVGGSNAPSSPPAAAPEPPPPSAAAGGLSPGGG